MFDHATLGTLAANLCLSGGAEGADLQWGMMAGRLGHKVIHWSFEGHRSSAPKNELVDLNDEQLEKADTFVARANKLIQRRWPTRSKFTANLLRRNYYQVAWADAVYAVSTIDIDHQVAGGTAWAVQMYLDRFLYDGEDPAYAQMYLYDQNQHVWWEWKGSWKMRSSPPPQPKGIWAGVGSRELSSTAKWEIRKLMGGYPVGAEQINSMFPLHEIPVTGEKVYVPEHKLPGHGLDDRVGGWATIGTVFQGDNSKYWLRIQEFPDDTFNWDDLKSQQSDLRHQYGLQRAHLKPNDAPEANVETAYYRMK